MALSMAGRQRLYAGYDSSRREGTASMGLRSAPVLGSAGRLSPWLCLLLLSSCGPGTSLSDLEKHRPAAQAKIAAIGALSEVVKGTPHVRDDGFDVPGPPPQFLPKSFNALAIAAEDLDDLAAS